MAVKGPAWRLALADVDGDGQKELVYGAYDGGVRCRSVDSDDLLWEVETGAFIFSLRAHDVDGCGKPEILAATAAGTLFCIDANGNVRWTHTSTHPLYAVDAGNFTGDGAQVVCGGVERSLSFLDPGGGLVCRHPISYFNRCLAAGDVDGDGLDELFYTDGKEEAAIIKLSGAKPAVAWSGRIGLPERYARKNWSGKSGSLKPGDAIACDINGDGKSELILGDGVSNRQTVLALGDDGEILWSSNTLEWFQRQSTWYEIFSVAFVDVTDYPESIPGRKVVVVAAGNVRLFSADGTAAGEVESRLGFADAAVDGRYLYLGSTPNGDNTVYRVRLDDQWQQSVSSLEPQGLAREIGENLAVIRRRALARNGKAEPASPYVLQEYYFGPTKDGADFEELLQQFGDDRGAVTREEYLQFVDAFRKVAPYPVFRNTVSRRILEHEPVMDSEGKPLVKINRYPLDSMLGTKTPDQIVEMVSTLERNGVPMSFESGHNDNPFIHLETAERMLQAAPTCLVAFESVEDVSFRDAYDYVTRFLGPLCDLCLKYGGTTKVIIKNKNMWWLSALSIAGVCRELFKGRRGEVLVASTEESYTRLSEINLMTRMSLWKVGLVGHLRAHVHKDMFDWNSYHEWQFPKSGHPTLRSLVAQTVLGSTFFSIRMHHIQSTPEGPYRDYTLTDLGIETAETFYHLLGKGLVAPPAREALANLSSVGILMHEPSEHWLEDAHNNHQSWLNHDTSEILGGVFPRISCGRANTPLPDYALSKVVFHKERCFGGLVPATPYGHVTMLPAGCDRTDAKHVESWWHTDGVRLWQDHGEKLTGAAAADALKRALQLASHQLPVRVEGDDVFYQVVKRTQGGWRLYAIDPGWLDPEQRTVRFILQRPGYYRVRDVLHGDAVVLEGKSFTLKVPAGAFRIVDIERVLSPVGVGKENVEM
jgi:hypothetical protein